MSTAEIIAELPRLRSPELALIEEKIRELILQSREASVGRIRTPRLAHPEQARDFIKQIVELAPDTNL